MSIRRPLHEDQGNVRAAIAAKLPRRGMRKRLAHELGISVNYLCLIINGDRPVPDRVAEQLGFKRVVIWERVEGEASA